MCVRILLPPVAAGFLKDSYWGVELTLGTVVVEVINPDEQRATATFTYNFLPLSGRFLHPVDGSLEAHRSR